MKKKLASLVAVTSLISGVLAAVVTPLPASAAVGAGEDREIASPVGWWAYDNVTAAGVTSLLRTDNARLTDVKVTYSGSTPKFSVAMVQNTGAYKTNSSWHYNQTPTALATYAINTKQRPTSVQCYVHSGATKCASVMITNTGANKQSWWFYVGSIAYLKSKITSARRMVSFGRILGTNSWSAVYVNNTGTDKINWAYLYGHSVSDINTYALAHKLRVVDLDRNDTGTYNALMDANPTGTPFYAYYGASLTTLVAKAQQLGQRIFDVTPYKSGSSTLYAVAMVNDLNGLSTTLTSVLGPKVPNGKYGFLLQHVGGSTLAGLQTNVAFEPASSLKVLYHYKTIVSEQSATTADADPISYQYDAGDSSDGDICPDDFSHVGSTNLKNADSLMMQSSDNRMTKGVLTKYGKAAMLAEAAHLKMTHTKINHNIGCPTTATHNATSLGDLSALYSAYVKGTDITNTGWRTQFASRMLNQSNYPSYLASICPLVKSIAASLHKTTAVANAFCAKITWIAKGGSYQYGDNAVTSPISWSQGTLTGLPYKNSAHVIVPSSFFYGDYFDQVTFSTAAKKTALSTARSTAYLDAMKPYLTAALATW
jgi:hypothetical protein